MNTTLHTANLLIQLNGFYPDFTLSETFLKFYVKHLEHLDTETLSKAVETWAYSNTRFPSVAELVELANSDVPL